ncbi:MAG TPA: sigma-54 dependent transcriptional regulator [Verrucomicrobiales bacterium]|nr:sigma-54 dependent transcriptional regulator [Verrucomicrobiales bacterium]
MKSPAPSPAVLIIEDEAALAQALRTACEQMGHRTKVTANARAGLEQAQQSGASLKLIVLDIGLPDRSGLDLLPELRRLFPEVPVLIITAHGSLQNAVAARQQGAADYLVKPLDLTSFEQAVKGLLRQASATGSGAPERTHDLPVLTGSSAAMQPVFKAIAHACTSTAPVLLRGPSGSGKTLAARVIHAHGSRAPGPFITQACGDLPPSGEHFSGRLMEQARGGTLLLDEISDLPADYQAQLLRLVENQALAAWDHDDPDVRIIAATHRDLAGEVTAGRFRKDLYFRLNVIEIVLPALRQRMDDIPSLTKTLLARIAPGRDLEAAPETLTRLASWDWPGHVRELRNALEHAASVSSGPLLLPSHLPSSLRGTLDTASIDRRLHNALTAWAAARLKQPGINYDTMHEQLESRLLSVLLPHFENRPTRLAAALNMNRNTLRKRLGRDDA